MSPITQNKAYDITRTKQKVQEGEGKEEIEDWCITVKCCYNLIGLLDFLQVLVGVLVSHVGRTDVQLEVRTVILEVVVVRQLCNTAPNFETIGWQAKQFLLNLKLLKNCENMSYFHDNKGPTVGDLYPQCDGGLVGPASSHVPDRVSPTSQQHQWQVPFLHKLHSLSMTCRLYQHFCYNLERVKYA